ncbi:carboxymuconolactone decarboxylase family protein [Streptomyces sp. I05A-00742]|uniref:carboxymuconolactone decarboxylase family protein n=1 Tax=Streptomyces sp. I05A-00742 TaxID=2732853 RepID=UPI001488D88A|nr:carboxymuconolactone decarboxylase family protein [Streptomyces sp. I05A-00742]
MTEDIGRGLREARIDRAAGYRLLDVLQDEGTQEATLPGLERMAPGFADWIVTSLFGGTYQRDGLSLRDRQIANLAALTALGGVEAQLAGHVRTGLRVGLTAEEVVEVFVHIAPYIGVPKALAGLRVATAALAADAGAAGRTAEDAA